MQWRRLLGSDGARAEPPPGPAICARIPSCVLRRGSERALLPGLPNSNPTRLRLFILAASVLMDAYKARECARHSRRICVYRVCAGKGGWGGLRLARIHAAVWRVWPKRVGVRVCVTAPDPAASQPATHGGRETPLTRRPATHPPPPCRGSARRRTGTTCGPLPPPPPRTPLAAASFEKDPRRGAGTERRAVAGTAVAGFERHKARMRFSTLGPHAHFQAARACTAVVSIAATPSALREGGVAPPHVPADVLLREGVLDAPLTSARRPTCRRARRCRDNAAPLFTEYGPRAGSTSLRHPSPAATPRPTGVNGELEVGAQLRVDALRNLVPVRPRLPPAPASPPPARGAASVRSSESLSSHLVEGGPPPTRTRCRRE